MTTPTAIDVRTPGEFSAVPLDLLHGHRDQPRHHLDETVVLIRRSGTRDAHAEQSFTGPGSPNPLPPAGSRPDGQFGRG